eukprot:m.43757 g.43757  ORF g.43757 m.43757 type:complete len:383 (+) comp14477_c0_seq1:192-1340(+)
MDEETTPKNPDQGIAQLLFEASNPDCTKDKQQSRAQLLSLIKEHKMAPFYVKACEVLKEQPDSGLLQQLQDANKADLAALDAKLDAAISQSEKKDAKLARAEYLCRIGDKAAAETAFRDTYEDTVSLGHRMDLIFYLIRLGLFHSDFDLVKRNLAKAEDLLNQGGDWDRRNRLKVYRGVYCVAVRDFAAAAALFLDTVSTFTSTELMEYKEFVGYTVLCSVLALARPELKKKVVHGPEIQEVLHDLPLIKDYLMALYKCDYAAFFKCLAEVEIMLKNNRFFSAHYRFYVREMRILAYKQLLESYRSVTLASMAKAFGVSETFVDTELSRFVAAGRLNCKIDKVGGVVETNRPDKKNSQYQAVIKQGDLLLNKIQKLSQITNI